MDKITSTVAVSRPAVQIDVSPRFSSSLVSARCPFAINSSFSMRSAPNKAKHIQKRKFRIFPLDYSILQRAYIG